MTAATEAARAIRDALKRELTQLAAEDKPLANRSLGALPSVVIIGVDKGVPVAAGFHFETQQDNTWPAELKLRTLRCPGNCPQGVYTFFLGERSAIDRYVADHGQALGMSPEDGAPFLVRLEIQAGTPGVGGPVDSARVSAAGPEWLSVKPECR
jgi:hypothetical protein